MKDPILYRILHWLAHVIGVLSYRIDTLALAIFNASHKTCTVCGECVKCNMHPCRGGGAHTVAK